jgi:hypothetical protein
MTLMTSRDSAERLNEEDDTFPLGMFTVVLSFVLSAVFDRSVPEKPEALRKTCEPTSSTTSGGGAGVTLVIGAALYSLSNFYFVGLAATSSSFIGELLTELAGQAMFCIGLGTTFHSFRLLAEEDLQENIRLVHFWNVAGYDHGCRFGGRWELSKWITTLCHSVSGVLRNITLQHYPALSTCLFEVIFEFDGLSELSRGDVHCLLELSNRTLTVNLILMLH